MTGPRSTKDIQATYAVSLAVAKDRRNLVRTAKPDEPFFLLGDTAWELFHKLDLKEAEMYLRNRAEKGFNWVMSVILAENDGLTVPSRAGHLPLYDQDPNRPNLAYFEHVDQVVALANSLGITLAIVPTWGRYVTGGLAGGPVVFDKHNAYTFTRFLAERYPFSPFILGGDTNRYWDVDAIKMLNKGIHPNDIPLTDYAPLTEAMVKGVRDGEKAAVERIKREVPEVSSYTSFMTFHSTQGWLGSVPAMASAQFPAADWLSFDCIQSGHLDIHPLKHMQEHTWQGTSSYAPVRTMYACLDGVVKPVIDLEPHYEATHHAFNPENPIWGAADLRNGAYQALFAGSCGYVYGCNSIWQMYTPSDVKSGLPIPTAYTEWYHELNLPGAYHMSTLRKIVLSLPDSPSRVPDDSIILSERNDTGDGLAGDKLVSGLRGKGWAMAHLPYGGKVTIDLERCKVGSSWKAWWIDTKCGATILADKGTSTGSKEWNAPTGGTKEDDWLLFVKAS